MPTPSRHLDLRAAIGRVSAAALAAGALQPIATEERRIEDQGVRFLVRMVSSLKAKEAAPTPPPATAGGTAAAANPFLPYDPALKVADLSPTHVCLLNKYYVLPEHLLIVTRSFEAQETLLGLADFEALWLGLAEIDGLGFYNGGRDAGASQPHKHLQLVPRALSPGETALPIEALFDRSAVAPALPFRHAFAWLDPALAANPAAAAAAALQRYRALLGQVGLAPASAGREDRQAGPYNLLLTRTWMLLVPRRMERFETISVNALGFAGSLFVRDSATLDLVRHRGPFTVLREVAVPA